MTSEMPADLLVHALGAKGFMPEDEGEFLHRIARLGNASKAEQ